MSNETVPVEPLTIDELRDRVTVTPDEAAALLGVHPGTAQRYMRDGSLPVVKVAGRRLVPAPQLLAMLTGGGDA